MGLLILETVNTSMFPNAQILQTVDTLKAPDAPILETVDTSKVRDAPIIETVDESKIPYALILNTFLILGGGQKGGQRGRLNAGRTGKRFAESAIWEHDNVLQGF